MKTSGAGKILIQRFEGLRTSAYKDSGGVWTIGYGHTRTAAALGDAGITLTTSECDRLFEGDILEAEKVVVALVKVQLSQGQFDALVSFVFNVGRGHFADSTLLKKLNASDYAGAAAEFERWVKAEGKTLAGLVRRRKAERERFEARDELA